MRSKNSRLSFIVKNGIFFLETEDEVIHLEEITNETQYYMDHTIFVWSVLEDGDFCTFFKKMEIENYQEKKELSNE